MSPSVVLCGGVFSLGYSARIIDFTLFSYDIYITFTIDSEFFFFVASFFLLVDLGFFVS
mgnify:CR=1 FL=1